VARLDRPDRERARNLRGASTAAERCLWDILRDRRLGGHKFRRQHPIPPWTADFACVEARLVIEVDGGEHGDARDTARDRALASQGWRVLRLWNFQIFQEPEGVAHLILGALRAASPSPHLSPIALATGEGA
jgi:very-short-patch-repair endonuclease